MVASSQPMARSSPISDHLANLARAALIDLQRADLW
jgi:hypothetical protein